MQELEQFGVYQYKKKKFVYLGILNMIQVDNLIEYYVSFCKCNLEVETHYINMFSCIYHSKNLKEFLFLYCLHMADILYVKDDFLYQPLDKLRIEEIPLNETVLKSSKYKRVEPKTKDVKAWYLKNKMIQNVDNYVTVTELVNNINLPKLSGKEILNAKLYYLEVLFFRCCRFSVGIYRKEREEKLYFVDTITNHIYGTCFINSTKMEKIKKLLDVACNYTVLKNGAKKFVKTSEYERVSSFSEL